MPLNIIMFRRKWPLDSIKRGYEHPFHPLPAITLLKLCGVTFFAVFLGYGTQLVAMIGFYIVVSLWFHFWRYRFVNRGAQFTMPWPKPRATKESGPPRKGGPVPMSPLIPLGLAFAALGLWLGLRLIRETRARATARAGYFAREALFDGGETRLSRPASPA
jgi:hypothetical protein